MNPDIAIVGGGAIGLSLAWELAQQGQRVCVLDRQQIGRAASWAGAGILPPTSHSQAPSDSQPRDPYEQLRALSHQLHGQWAEQLRELTGIDNGFRRCGGLYLATRAGEAAALGAQAMQWGEEGIIAQRLSPDQLIGLEPELAAAVHAQRIRVAYHLPDECQLRNPRHLQALAAACRIAGVTFVEQAEVEAVEPHGRGYLLRTTNPQTQVIESPQVCLCSGAWADHWLRHFGGTQAIYPMRGQMLLYRCPRAWLTRVVNEGHRYLVPREDGYLLVGSNEEEVGFTPGTTPEVLESLRQWATGFLPQLETLEPEKSWSGFRPATIDGFPFLGKLPGFDNLYLAAGHYRSGLHLSPGTAVCMADVILGRSPRLDLSAFRITRGLTSIGADRMQQARLQQAPA